jgi:hypothetical protein
MALQEQQGVAPPWLLQLAWLLLSCVLLVTGRLLLCTWAAGDEAAAAAVL